MSIPREHHFLPQFALEPWCGTDGKLTAYSKPYKDAVVTGRYAPSEVGKQTGLYTYDNVPDGQAQVVETAFMQKVDFDAAQAFATVNTKGADKVSSADRTKLAVYILSLLARHPEAVAHAKEIGRRSLIDELDKDPEELSAAGLPADKTFSGVLAEKQPALLQNVGLSVIPSVITASANVGRLVALKWCDVRFTQTSTDLLISDRACLLDGNLQERCAIVLPVAPRRAIVICSEREQIAQLKARSQSEFVKLINKRSVLQAVEYVYANGMQHLPLVQSHLRQRTDGADEQIARVAASLA